MDSSGALDADSMTTPVIFCDAVESLAVHNGVARLLLTRLSADGASAPALELLAPTVVVAQIIEALQQIKL